MTTAHGARDCPWFEAKYPAGRLCWCGHVDDVHRVHPDAVEQARSLEAYVLTHHRSAVIDDHDLAMALYIARGARGKGPCESCAA
ncbi:MAG TPA: hypothetical protein VHN80_11400 [Kineosporiaceae bacterium]|nr:hypothetical protein [Kineosporiaceae bacterium]